MEPLARARSALSAFFFCYLALLLGVLSISAAEQSALEQPFDELSWARAALLSGGLAAYLAGLALFRRQLTIGTGTALGAAALLALFAIPLGAEVSAALQIAVLVGLLGVMIALDRPADG